MRSSYLSKSKLEFFKSLLSKPASTDIPKSEPVVEEVVEVIPEPTIEDVVEEVVESDPETFVVVCNTQNPTDVPSAAQFKSIDYEFQNITINLPKSRLSGSAVEDVRDHGIEEGYAIVKANDENVGVHIMSDNDIKSVQLWVRQYGSNPQTLSITDSANNQIGEPFTISSTTTDQDFNIFVEVPSGIHEINIQSSNADKTYVLKSVDLELVK